MIKYNDSKYDNVRGKISSFIKVKGAVDEIMYFMDDPDNLSKNLEFICRTENICVNEVEWLDISRHEIISRREYIANFEKSELEGTIARFGEENSFTLSEDRKSNWQIFKNKKLLEELKFSEEVIKNIENDTYSISKSISIDLIDNRPVKGLVIGGVQSGKTTNMASLMAMGADQGFNLFIILSGTIENLRLQTESRIKHLIEGTGRKRGWKIVSNPENTKGNRFRNHFNKETNLYMVVLKNVTRIKNLIDWLTSDVSYLEQMRIILIDDEADQASVNTSKDPELDRKTINKLISNLVSGKNKNGETLDEKYKAMNYIGYTATPYANILSESPSDDSLYPQNFISILSKSNQHFGPRQIFGSNIYDEDRLNIIKVMDDKSYDRDLFLSCKSTVLPKEFKEAIAYFICAASSLRMHNFGKPVSMLVHMSNKIEVHNHIFISVKEWFTNNSDEILEISKKIWDEEINNISLNDISKKLFVYENKSLKPHKYSEIEPTLKELLKEFGFVRIAENGNHIYHNGVIASVDHSGFVPDKDKIDLARLVYPERGEDNKNTPVFFVIGGATLSRGLTLEGLITSFFLRTPSAADTLIQMGRWFGYRINYELYPRIWLTNNTLEQFKYMTDVEEDLINEIKYLISSGTDFSQIGPKIMHNPKVIDLTAKNKSYAMEFSEYDFTGFTSQTDKFDNDIEIQKYNIIVTENFIDGLGNPIVIDEKNISSVFWEGIKFDSIRDNLLSKFTFNSRIKALNNIPELISWIEKVTNDEKLQDWNVILGGTGMANSSNNNWELKNISYNKVIRTRKPNIFKEEIDIGVLRNPRDLYVDLKNKNDKVKALLEKYGYSGKRNVYDEIRNQAGLNKVPQLIIYKIDKSSTPRMAKEEDPSFIDNTRVSLGIDSDLIGLFIQIPRGDKNYTYSTKVTVKIMDIAETNLNEYDQKE